MRNGFLAAIAFFFAGALLSPASAQTTKLRIEVKNTEGKPIDRASVIVKFAGGRSIAKLGKKIRTSWEMKTNQEGVASIPLIPQGKITVQVIAKNHATFGQQFDINEEEKTLEITLKPPQSQCSAHE